MNHITEAKYAPLAIFGLPVNNAGLEKTSEICLNIIRRPPYEYDLFHATSIAPSLITKCYGWCPTTVTQPELLSIIRKTNLSLAPSRLLRFISLCLGTSLAKPVTAKELLISICQELSAQKKSVFILGGAEQDIKAAAIRLHDDFHGLRLVGIATPPIFTQGEDLINARERDALLVEQINASRADFLLVNLGTPKQDLWLERVRHQLNIPFVFTVGDMLPQMKKSNEKVLKQTSKQKDSQDGVAKILKKTACYIGSFVKLAWMTVPLVVYHTINRSVFQWFYETKNPTALPNKTRLFLSASRSIAFISLPPLIDATNVEILKQRFEEASSHDVIVLDFLNTRHIQPEGFYFLIEAWLQRRKQHREIYGFCPTSDIKFLMKVHRTWDVFKDTICDSAEILMSRYCSPLEITPFFDTFTQQDNMVILSILGALDNRINYEAYLKKLIPILGQKDCTLDLSYCTLIDNSGFTFLLNLRKRLQLQGRRLTLCSVSRALHRQFHATGVDTLFF